MVDVTMDTDGDGPGLGAVILQNSEAWELQFRASLDDLVGLRSIREADFFTRRSLHIGTVFDAPIHWCINDDVVSALVGHDDETWQIAFSMPAEAVDRLAAMAADLRPEQPEPEPDPLTPYPGQLEIF